MTFHTEICQKLRNCGSIVYIGSCRSQYSYGAICLKYTAPQSDVVNYLGLQIMRACAEGTTHVLHPMSTATATAEVRPQEYGRTVARLQARSDAKLQGLR